VKVKATRGNGFAHALAVRDHVLVADEPRENGGSDTGPTAQELLALSLASCTAITVEMYAERKGWDVGRLEVEVDYEPDPKGECSRFEVLLRLPPGLSDDQAGRIEKIASRCPVHRTLVGGVQIEDRVEIASNP
jgi:putative redox protein